MAYQLKLSRTTDMAQFGLRLAIGFGYLLAVADRFGLVGQPGTAGVAWGNWSNFCVYTNQLMPYLSLTIASVFALLATAGEVIFGLMLIVGFKTRLAAYGSFALALSFALSMLFFSGYRDPFTYSVFVVSLSSLLLAGLPGYRWSLDSRIMAVRQ